LEELSRHNAIEHDASLTRRDVALQADQSRPDLGLVGELLGGASGDGGERLTKADLSRALARRRREARSENAEYTESFFHNGFGAAKYVPLSHYIGMPTNELQLLNYAHDFRRHRQRPRTDAYGRALRGGLGAAGVESVWADDDGV
jgi:hypothetical protein